MRPGTAAAFGVAVWAGAAIPAVAQVQMGAPPRSLGTIPAGDFPAENQQPVYDWEHAERGRDPPARRGTGARANAPKESMPKPKETAKGRSREADSAPADAGLDELREARAYEKGEGVPRDDAEAVRHYEAAAALNNSEAAFNLGFRHARGLGVPQDDRKAVQWYRRAAAGGHLGAQNNLGFMMAQGRGGPRDDREAVNFYRAAADRGYGAAQVNLGHMYAAGRGVAQSDVEALNWYVKAATGGYAPAKSMLGTIYATGRGVPRDETMANFWFTAAAESGPKSANAEGTPRK